jgi:hypothetical protein
LCETMWSLASPRAKRISSPQNFHSSAEKDFFNTIGSERTWRDARVESVMRSRATWAQAGKTTLEKAPSALDGVESGRATRDHNRAADRLCHDSVLELLSSGSAFASKSLESAARSKPRRRGSMPPLNGTGISPRRNQKRRCAGRVLATWASDCKRRGWRDVQAGDCWGVLSGGK